MKDWAKFERNQAEIGLKRKELWQAKEAMSRKLDLSWHFYTLRFKSIGLVIFYFN